MIKVRWSNNYLTKVILKAPQAVPIINYISVFDKLI